MNNIMETAQPKLSAGIDGLDKITYGGFVTGSTNLLRGGSGVGKTTIAMQLVKNIATHRAKSA